MGSKKTGKTGKSGKHSVLKAGATSMSDTFQQMNLGRLILTAKTHWPFTIDELASGTAQIAQYTILDCLHVDDTAPLFLVTTKRKKSKANLRLISFSEVQDKQILRELANLYEKASKISNRHVIKVFETGFSGPDTYLVTEHLSGRNLKGKIRKAFNPKRAILYTAQIASGLNALHQAGIVHGALEPGNILLRDDDQLVISDFSLALLLCKHPDCSEIWKLAGMPYYVSPEHVNGKRIVPSCDFYALGVILCEMLTGNPPYTQGSDTDVKYAHIGSPVPELPKKLAVLQPILDKLLAKKQNKRYPDAMTLIDDLVHVQTQMTKA